MATITAAQVKELRQATDAGMMECKKALVEAEGDFDAAVDILRKNGLAKAAKKAGRATNEGRVTAMVCKKDATKGAVVEINCETDFVAMNDKFANFCETMTSAVLHNDPADVEALKASEYEGQNVGEMLTEAIHTIGENMQVGNFKRIEIEGTGALVSYIHMNGKIGVLAGFNFNNEATATDERFIALGKDVAMQIAATNPVSLDQDSVPAEVAAKEMEIYKAQAAESGKPENIQEKIATGRMQKFYKENCLVEQDFVKNPDITVTEHINAVAKEIGDEIKCTVFARIALGE